MIERVLLPEQRLPSIPGPPSSSPSEEARLAIATFEWLFSEQPQVFEHVGQRIAGIRSFAVLALAYATGMILVTAVRTGKQSWVGAGSFAMTVWAFGWIILWERRPDAGGLVAAGRATFACVGGWAVERLPFVPPALPALLCERRVRIGGILVRMLLRSFSATQRRSIDSHGRVALFFLSRIAMAGERCRSLFLSVAESVFTVAGNDIETLCLS